MGQEKENRLEVTDGKCKTAQKRRVLEIVGELFISFSLTTKKAQIASKGRIQHTNTACWILLNRN